VESAAIRRPPPLPGLIQVGLIFGLLLLAAVAWALTDDRMSGMDAGPGTDTGTLGFFLGVWVVMMAAMMFPSIAPMVLMHVRIREGRAARGEATQAGTTLLFVAGYLVSWTTAGLIGYALYEIGAALFGDTFAWDNAGPYLAAGIILGAAVYQLTPLKDVCLRNCRHPLMFLMEHWRPDRVGALRMGIIHGGYCVGCCWALMAALFALGVMSIGWMAFIAALIAIEKLLPWKEVGNRGIAILLLVLGLAVAFAPEDVPGLTLPDSTEAMEAMEAMGMEEESKPTGMDESMEEAAPAGMDDSMDEAAPAMEESMEEKPGGDGGSMDEMP
jgi:predicted metal-binding membrane protein